MEPSARALRVLLLAAADLQHRAFRRCCGFRKLRTSPVWLFLISLVVLVGMWLERFIIVVVSLHRDFLTSSWGMYYPTRWDWMTYIGTIGMFLAAMFLFVRILPMISIFEMRTLLPEAEVKRMKRDPSLRTSWRSSIPSNALVDAANARAKPATRRSTPTARSRSKGWPRRSDSITTKFRWWC